MTGAPVSDEVIGRLPEWRGANVTELAGGLTNRAWLLVKDDRRAVLKIDDAPRGAPYGSRREEAIVQAAAASAGLANRVLFVDEQVYLTQFVEGTVWNPSCLDEKGKLEQLAASLRRLHALPPTGRTFDAIGAANRYRASLVNPNEELVSRCDHIIRSVRLPKQLCCCHNDLVAGNIITTPALRFIDWEYACDNDPLFDLATIVAEHELDAIHACALLDAYFDGDGARWRSRLADQQQLYLALSYLWLASRSGSSDKALARLGARLIS